MGASTGRGASPTACLPALISCNLGRSTEVWPQAPSVPTAPETALPARGASVPALSRANALILSAGDGAAGSDGCPPWKGLSGHPGSPLGHPGEDCRRVEAAQGHVPCSLVPEVGLGARAPPAFRAPVFSYLIFPTTPLSTGNASHWMSRYFTACDKEENGAHHHLGLGVTGGIRLPARKRLMFCYKHKNHQL